MAAKIRRVDYDWHLRRVMAEHGMFNTTDLTPHLAERGIELSAVQVYRLVAQRPERLNLRVLAALCDIFGCSPADLIEPRVETVTKRRKTATDTGSSSAGGDARRGRRPARARIVDDDR